MSTVLIMALCVHQVVPTHVVRAVESEITFFTLQLRYYKNKHNETSSETIVIIKEAKNNY